MTAKKASRPEPEQTQQGTALDPQAVLQQAATDFARTVANLHVEIAMLKVALEQGRNT